MLQHQWPLVRLSQADDLVSGGAGQTVRDLYVQKQQICIHSTGHWSFSLGHCGIYMMMMMMI
jgi:hypothetical protein